MRTRGQAAAEELEAQEAPTQPAQRRKTPQITKKSAQQKKASAPSGAAKKTASKHHPRPQQELIEFDFEQELEDEDEEEEEEDEEDEDADNAMGDTGNLNDLRRAMNDLYERAKGIPHGIQELERVVEERLPRTHRAFRERAKSRRARNAGDDSDYQDKQSQPDDREEQDSQSSERLPSPTFHLPKARKIRKRRVPWTAEEEQFLIDRVAKHGPKWASFVTKYGQTRLIGRDQMALKDKARNIRLKWIETGQERKWLTKHPMWDQVTVGEARRGVHRIDDGQQILPPNRNRQDIADVSD